MFAPTWYLRANLRDVPLEIAPYILSPRKRLFRTLGKLNVERIIDYWTAVIYCHDFASCYQSWFYISDNNKSLMELLPSVIWTLIWQFAILINRQVCNDGRMRVNRFVNFMLCISRSSASYFFTNRITIINTIFPWQNIVHIEGKDKNTPFLYNIHLWIVLLYLHIEMYIISCFGAFNFKFI